MKISPSHQCSHSLPSHTFNKAPSWSLQMPLHSGQICALTFLPRPAQSSPSLPAPGWLAVELQPIKHCEKEGPRKAFHWVTDQTQDFIIRICFVKKGGYWPRLSQSVLWLFQWNLSHWPNPEMCGKLSDLAYYTSFTTLMTNIPLDCPGHPLVCACHS